MPLTGPAPGLENFWLAEGNPFGITLAGGIGWQLAKWIVEGEPGIDMWPCDTRRFGSHGTRAFCAVKTEEANERTYRVPKPGEELEAARGMKTSAIHDLLAARGACFGEISGWERPNWFAPRGSEAVERFTFGRSNAFEPVGGECEAVSEAAGLADITAMARFSLHGPDAAAVLDWLVAGRQPEVGAVATGYVLTRAGTIRSQLTLWREQEDRFFLTGPVAAEIHDFDLLCKSVAGKDAEAVNLTGRYGGLLLAGPKAGAILSAIDGQATSEDGAVSDAGRVCTLALAPARVLRSRVGDREAFEMHTPMEHLRRVFLALLDAGAGEGLRLVGIRALNSLRLEQGSPVWGAELTRAVDPLSVGLETAIDLAKPSFRGRDAVLERRASVPEKRLVLLELSNDSPWDPVGMEPVQCEDGSLLGATTSGGYGHFVNKRLALVFLSAAVPLTDLASNVIILGERCRCRVLTSRNSVDE